MSADVAPHRDRAHEASEQLRAERQAKGKCIDCGQRSRTQRCKRCSKRVEANTNRYVGQSRKGRMSHMEETITDIDHAIETLGQARREWLAVRDVNEPNPRKRRELLIEPRSKVELAQRFLLDVLERNPGI